MADDTKKDALVGAAGVGAAAVALASATASVLAAAIPATVALAIDTWRGLQDRRIESWWLMLVGGEHPDEELAERIRVGLDKEREDVIRGVVGGAKAAANTIDDASVSAIAMLSRLYFAGEVQPWLYRAALDVFEQSTAEELANVRALCVEVAKCKERYVLIHALPFDNESPSKVYGASSRPGEKYIVGHSSGDGPFLPIRDDLEVRDNHVVLATILHAQRIFQLLRRAMLLDDPQAGGFGAATARNLGVIDRTVARVLARALLLE